MDLYSTITKNKKMSEHLGDAPVWIFGYGSLIHKVDFPYLEKRTAFVDGWERRFWMASQDHRGTPDKPGRVLTIHPSKHASCFGIIYLIEPEVLFDLDHREQNGYLRQKLNSLVEGGNKQEVIAYIGDPSAPVYRQEYDNHVIATQIVNSIGPSGPNSEYLYKLADALRQFAQHDEHVFDLERRVKELQDVRDV